MATVAVLDVRRLGDSSSEWNQGMCAIWALIDARASVSGDELKSGKLRRYGELQSHWLIGACRILAHEQ